MDPKAGEKQKGDEKRRNTAGRRPHEKGSQMQSYDGGRRRSWIRQEPHPECLSHIKRKSTSTQGENVIFAFSFITFLTNIRWLLLPYYIFHQFPRVWALCSTSIPVYMVQLPKFEVVLTDLNKILKPRDPHGSNMSTRRPELWEKQACIPNNNKESYQKYL